MNPADRAFHNKIFIFQPREEAGKNTPDIINRHLAGPPLHLIIGQILSQIIRCDLLRRLSDTIQHCFDGFRIVCQRFFRASLDSLCSDKCFYCVLFFDFWKFFALFKNHSLKRCFQHHFQVQELFIVEIRQHFSLYLVDNLIFHRRISLLRFQRTTAVAVSP